MKQLIIGNKLINAEIEDIIKQLRAETGYFKDIVNKNTDLICTCVYHKNGQERNPSLSISIDKESDDYGCYHCFTCGEKGFITKLVGDCFNEDISFGEEWLVERFGDIFVQYEQILPEITFNKKSVSYMDESILDEYSYFHPYMFQRKLTEDVIRKYRIGYDEKHNAITFPVWDEHNKLVMITERCVDSKKFYIPSDVQKPVYLLNYAIRENISSVYVTESQINALTLCSWGYPAIALFGTGSSYQYSILNKCGIRNYCLCFDGDDAGDKGRNRFLENIRNDVIVTSKCIPRGRDVNDLTKEEFDNLAVF